MTCKNPGCDSEHIEMVGLDIARDTGEMWFRWLCQRCGATWASQ